MKKSVLYLLAILFVFSSCSEDEFNDTEIFFEYFEEWGITVPYQDVSNSKTYSLLKNLIDYLDENQTKTITFPSSSLNHPSVTHFNNFLRNSEEAANFFKRRDCVFVLISTYLINLKTECGYVDNYNFKFAFLELVLSSDMCMSKMNVAEKVQLMALALERIKYEKCGLNPFNIVISIMLSSNYIPFLNAVNDINPILLECLRTGTHSVMIDDSGTVTQYTDDLIKKYAKQFINDNK